ncbi:MAG: peptidase S41 [Prevotella sp.]|nr:peptidase S41 [Candidatus Prevotella equi]
MLLPNEIIIPQVAEMVRKGHTVTLPLRGFSMRPYLEDKRDKALLSSVPLYLNVGDVILAEISPKRYALHRIVSIDGDIITMYGDGNFTPEYIERQDVLAIALGFYRKGSTKLSSVEGFWYRMYWKTWVMLRPIRRYLLLIWKLYHYPKDTLKRIKQKLFT